MTTSLLSLSSSLSLEFEVDDDVELIPDTDGFLLLLEEDAVDASDTGGVKLVGDIDTSAASDKLAADDVRPKRKAAKELLVVAEASSRRRTSRWRTTKGL
jgi:hypothetical protein